MAVRTENQVLDLVQDITKLLAHVEEFASGDFLTDVGDILTELAVGDPVAEDDAISRQLEIVIRRLESLYDAAVQLCIASYPALGRLASSPALGNNNMNLDYFQDYMIDNSTVIENRGFTKDTATTVTGSGDGLVTISSTDINGDVIDVGHAEDLSFVCVDASGVGSFQIRGEDSAPYAWQENGSGLDGRSYDYPYGIADNDFGDGQARAVSGQNLDVIGGKQNQGNLIRNGDFESSISGTGSDKLPQWTINSGDSNIAQEDTDPLNGELSLEASGNFEMDHDFREGLLQTRVAYSICVKLERKNSADGDLTIKVMDADEGTTHGTLTQDLTNLSNDTPVPIQPVHFFVPADAEELKVQVELASNTTGEVVIDDVMVGPATLVDGYLVSVHDGTIQDSNGNAQGRFKTGDTFVIQTSDAGTGLIQRFYVNIPSGRYFANDSSPTANWNDPTL